MIRSFILYHDNKEFPVTINSQEAIDLNNEIMRFNVNYFFKRSRAVYYFIRDMAQNDQIDDIDNNCSYRIRGIQYKGIEWPPFTAQFEILLIPLNDIRSQTITYNVTNFGQCTFLDSINYVNETINEVSANMATQDQALLRELVDSIIKSERIEKSGLEKFKEMLMNNTDVLGLFAQILLAILMK